MPLLAVKGVSKAFGGIQALNSCSFSVDQGTVTGLIGPNGSGKTTVFNVITGYERPDAGEVLYQDQAIHGQSPRAVFQRGIGRTFQSPRIFPRLTLIENLKIPVRASGGPQTPEDDVNRWLEFVGLDRYGTAQAGSLSYGQRKLLEFAMMLAANPQLVLLDEPAGGVNPAMMETMARLITEMNRRGVTFLIVEHNMGFVMSLCQHVVVMHRGQVIASGPPAVVQEDQAVLDAYLGD
ncbi:MAG: ABC transporter ATP-binding protein [Firmicutes bacterium]|nr:ABC transporter ATP-binding protein [Bacillota bacterium]